MWTAIQIVHQEKNPAMHAVCGVWGNFETEKEGYDWVASIDVPQDNISWTIVPLGDPNTWPVKEETLDG